MNTARTYTCTAAGTGFYTWQPRILAHDTQSGCLKVYHPTAESYRRFVRLANSGRYQVAIVEDETVAFTLSRKPVHVPARVEHEEWAIVDGLNQRIDW